MKKTVTVVTCDVCGSEISHSPNSVRLPIPGKPGLSVRLNLAGLDARDALGNGASAGSDICERCLALAATEWAHSVLMGEIR